jgi:hypothetical protein
MRAIAPERRFATSHPYSLAIDGKVEQSPIAQPALTIEIEPDSSNLLRRESAL